MMIAGRGYDSQMMVRMVLCAIVRATLLVGKRVAGGVGV